MLFEKTNGKEDLFLFLMEGTVSKIDEKEYIKTKCKAAIFIAEMQLEELDKLT